MMMTLNPLFESMRDQLLSVPRQFESDGTLLFSGRNQIRQFRMGDRLVAVKRYKRLSLPRSLFYRFVKPSKAQRAYENAFRIAARGFSTPAPVAWFGDGRTFYYACLMTTARAVREELIEREPYNEEMVLPYARFVADLHEAGVLHRDLNPTNVLYTKTDSGDYRFELIDINRMRFYDGPVPKAECMENLTLFWWLTDVYRQVLAAYAEARGWTEADVAEAVSVKQRHDQRWVRRKKFTGWWKRKLKKK